MEEFPDNLGYTEEKSVSPSLSSFLSASLSTGSSVTEAHRGGWLLLSPPSSLCLCCLDSALLPHTSEMGHLSSPAPLGNLDSFMGKLGPERKRGHFTCSKPNRSLEKKKKTTWEKMIGCLNSSPSSGLCDDTRSQRLPS